MKVYILKKARIFSIFTFVVVFVVIAFLFGDDDLITVINISLTCALFTYITVIATYFINYPTGEDSTNQKK